MINQDLQKYLVDEIQMLSIDSENQIEHIKKIHAICDTLLSVYHEKEFDKFELAQSNILKQINGRK